MEVLSPRFLDSEGRLKIFPSKRKDRLAALIFLTGRFEPGRRYAESEVNDLLYAAHAFADPCLLRRELYNHHLLDRERNGSAYWLPAEPPAWMLEGDTHHE